MSLLKLIFTICLFLVISGCGGSSGFLPVITGVKAQSLMFGRTATIYLGGKDLRSNLVVDAGTACTNPSFAANSSTDLLVLNCLVKSVGEFTLTVKTETGELIFSGSLNVPKPEVAILTNKGTISVELDPVLAPVSSANFLSYVGSGFYSGTLFHRVIAGFVIQAGGYTTGLVKKTNQLNPIVLESSNGLSNKRGTLAMARTNVFNSATSEFYINLAENLSLDYKNAANPGYAVFGTVTQGLDDVVDAIAAEPTGLFNGFTDVPIKDITINLVLQSK
jgi:cyclophilin family peptidyl-prolyl cis-trans isomerase